MNFAIRSRKDPSYFNIRITMNIDNSLKSPITGSKKIFPYADLNAIHKAEIHLSISTHFYFEIAQAHGINDVAMLSAITQAKNLESEVKVYLNTLHALKNKKTAL